MSDFRNYVLRNEADGTYYRMSKNMWTENKSEAADFYADEAGSMVEEFANSKGIVLTIEEK